MKDPAIIREKKLLDEARNNKTKDCTEENILKYKNIRFRYKKNSEKYQEQLSS